MHKLKLWVIFALIFSPSAFAQNSVQKLDRAKSNLHFELESDVLQLSGKFNSYSGTLSLDSANRPVKVELRIDASDVDVAPVENLPFISPEAIFRAIPQPVMTFTSTDIAPLNAGRYRVTGHVRRGSREWNTSFTASLAHKSAQQSEVFMTMRGPIMDFASELPIQFKGTRDEGLIEARLVFGL